MPDTIPGVGDILILVTKYTHIYTHTYTESPSTQVAYILVETHPDLIK